MSDTLKCPKCEQTEDIWGTEIMGDYDGVMYWVCKPCNFAFPRWGEGKWPDMHRRSQRYADTYNDGAGTR